MEKAKQRLVQIIKEFAAEHGDALQALKTEATQINRPDFVWHYLLSSFATMGNSKGHEGLIRTKANYERVRFDVLEKLSPEQRAAQVHQVCKDARIRMPNIKAGYILGCFSRIQMLGGVEQAKAELLSKPGAAGKIKFLRSFPGIGKKYARNIMMDVYHEEFRNNIAIDSRINGITSLLGLSFCSYEEHESFYLDAAREVGINGWELDRLLYGLNEQVKQRLLVP